MNTDKKEITIIQPDDWHLHLRTKDVMREILLHTKTRFKRALIMPNLAPPITTQKMAENYRSEILEMLPKDSDFEPLMTLYLTPNTTKEDVTLAGQSPYIVGIKLYPAGATTNSDAGVSSLTKLYPVFEEMQKHDLILEIHGESTDPHLDIFDREADFIDNTLSDLVQNFPELKIVFEHVTTKDAVDFVKDSVNVGATITPHHLLLNRNDIFKGGLRPHHYCLPVLKRESHRQSLIEAATGESEKFFLGTDSAPHNIGAKESSCGCAGIYNSHAAIELYAEVFDSCNRLDKLEKFASIVGAKFYDRPINKSKLTLIKEEWIVPNEYKLGDQALVPFRAGEIVSWKVKKLK